MMSDWEKIPLGELCDICAGGTPSRGNPSYFGGGIPWVKIGDMLQGRITHTQETISQTALDNSAAKMLPVGTVLISIFATIGRTAVLDIEAATNQAVAGVNPRDTKRLDPTYLRRFLDHFSDQLQQQARGVAQVNINSGILRTILVPVPTFGEQLRIAEVLDRAEALRAKRRAGVVGLERLRQAIFHEMFGDPASNSRGWPIARIAEVSEVQGGLTINAAREKNPHDAPYLRVANVHRESLDLTEIKRLYATDAEIARVALQRDDLLIVEGHGNDAEIGRSALWDASIDPCLHQNHLIRVRFSQDAIVPLFGCIYLNSQGGRRHLLRAGKTTSGLNTISVSDVRSTPIARPPLPLQQEFARRIALLERLKAAQRASLAEMDALFASLQHRAFRGEL